MIVSALPSRSQRSASAAVSGVDIWVVAPSAPASFAAARAIGRRDQRDTQSGRDAFREARREIGPLGDERASVACSGSSWP